MKIKYLLLSVFMLALWSCETDVVNPDEVYPDPYLDIDSGDTDFSTYVSIGASITLVLLMDQHFYWVKLTLTQIC